jgi:GNAT superfamily N-acetyltransferase
MTKAVAAELTIRPFHDEDEGTVLELLRVSLGAGPGGARTTEFFRWKHQSNPFARSYMLVAEVGDRIIGLRAFMRWRFRADGTTIRAARAVDTATHPDYQGRGVFATLTRRALEDLMTDTDLIFNTPNDRSMPGYLKMGWRTVGRVPVAIRVRRPLHMLVGTLTGSARDPGGRPNVHAPRAAEVLGEATIGRLLEETTVPEARMMTERTPEYLLWRYASAPMLDYRAELADGPDGIVGLVVFRVRPRGRLWETMVTELLVQPGDHATGRRLLRRAIHAAPVDHLICTFPHGSSARVASLGCGFVPSGRGPTLVANRLRDMSPAPYQLESWGLTLGDVEVF